MRFVVRFSLAGGRLAVRVPDTRLEVDEPDAVALNAQDGTILAVGDEALAYSGTEGVVVAPVFDPADSDPTLIAAAVAYFTDRERERVHRGWRDRLAPALTDRYHLELHVPALDDVDEAIRVALIEELLEQRVTRLIINGIDVTERPQRLRRPSGGRGVLSRNAGPIVLVGLITMMVVMFVLTAVLPYCPEGQQRHCEGAMLGKLIGLVCECV